MNTYYKTLLIPAMFVLLVACNQSIDKQAVPAAAEANTESTIKNGMIKVSVLYPNAEGKEFNMDYYVNTHMKMVDSLAGDSIRAMAIEEGIAGGAPEAPVPYLAMGHLYFDNIKTFENTMGQHSEALFADIPNFTNCEPIVQISVVRLPE